MSVHVPKSVRAGARGFSLLEVMVTVSIIIILSTVMIPQFNGMVTRARLHGATRELVSDLMKVRMQAVAESKLFQVDFKGSSYEIAKDMNNSGGFESGEVISVRNVGAVYRGVGMTAPRTIVYNPRGTVVGTTVTVTNPKGTKRVMVNVAGRVKVES